MFIISHAYEKALIYKWFLFFLNIICGFGSERKYRTIELAEANPCPKSIHLMTEVTRVLDYSLKNHEKSDS